MATQIDIIRKRRESGQGSWVRIEEIGKAPMATLDDPLLVLRGKRQSHTATWRKSPKNTEGNVPLAASVANELETKTKVKSLFAAGFLLLVCDGLGNLPREDAEFFRFSARIFLEITPIDTLVIITLYKNVTTIPKEGRHFVILAYLLSHRRRYHSSYCCSRIAAHAELCSEIGLCAAFQRISGETRRRHQL
jgi:hypothetical protein